MKCLDTNFIVAVLRRNKETLKTLKELESQELICSTVTAFELLLGAKLSNREKNIKEVKNVLSRINVIDFNLEVADLASTIQANLFNRGKPIDVKDTFIAATCLFHNCELISRDKHFSEVKGLKIKNW